MKKSSKKLLLSAALVFAAGSLAAEEERKLPVPTEPSEIVWSPSLMEYSLGGNDPIGGWNRAMFAFNDCVMRYVARPVSWVYCSIIPKPGVDIIWNMCRNLEYPMHLFSCLGSAEWTGAWDETVRFFVNTTVGIGGMLDPAKDWMHYHRTDANIGRMFHVWGIGPGCTFIFPCMSFVNVRDGVGAIFDYFLDLRTYIPYTSGILVNEAIVAESQYDAAMRGTLDDRYHRYRMLMIAKRELQLRMWEYHVKNAAKEVFKDTPATPEENAKINENVPPVIPAEYKDFNVVTLDGFAMDTPAENQPYLDTLYSTLFTPKKEHSFWYMRRSVFNRDFISLADCREVKMNNAEPLEYYFWKNKDEEPKDKLVILLTGIGSQPDGSSALAMAEIFHDRGWQAITLGSTFTPQFMLTAGHGDLPGYTPRDAENMRKVLAQILKDLRKENKIAENTWITLLGWSFGGLHTLHIASMEENDNTLGISRFVALNPPAELDYALAQSDALAEVSKGWDREKAINTVAHAFGVAFTEAQENSVTLYNPAIKATREARYPFIQQATIEQAKFLISLSLNTTVREVLLSRHIRKPFRELENAEPANRQYLNMQLDDISYRDYTNTFLIQDKHLPRSFEGMAQNSGLHAVDSTLRTNQNIRVFHSLNDFLVSPEQRRYLQETLGERIHWFNRGGHLGYWFLEKAQDMIYEASCPPGMESASEQKP